MRYKILNISSVDYNTNRKFLFVDLEDEYGRQRKFIIKENFIKGLDLVYKFEREYFKVGDSFQIEFNEVNKDSGYFYPNIWRITNHRKKDK